jgi:hypothetical protein
LWILASASGRAPATANARSRSASHAKQLVHQDHHIDFNHLAPEHPDDIAYNARPGVSGVSATDPSCHLTPHA